MNQSHIAAPVRSRLAAVTEPHDHLVGFYETDGFFAASVAEFLLPALEEGHGAVVTATPEHRVLIEQALRGAGVDLDAARDSDQLVMLDAHETLGSVLVDGRPDETRLQQLVSATFERASQGNRPVRVFGELATLLWQDGNLSAAMVLEELGDQLARELPCRVLCLYPSTIVDAEERTLPFLTVCEQHTGVIPSEDYSTLPDLDDRFRRVALLQQETLVARAQRHTVLQQQLELDIALAELYEHVQSRNNALRALFDDIERDTAAAHSLLTDLRSATGDAGGLAQQILTELGERHERLRSRLVQNCEWLTPLTNAAEPPANGCCSRCTEGEDSPSRQLMGEF